MLFLSRRQNNYARLVNSFWNSFQFDTVKKSAMAEKLAEKAKDEITKVDVDGEEIDFDNI